MIAFLNSNLLLLFLAFIPLFFSLFKKRKAFFTIFTSSLISTTFAVELLKKITAISRPFVQNPSILGIQTNIPTSFSFPSLHTALATFFAWSLAFLKPKLSWLGFAFLLLIAFSRVYLGLHYFQDLVAGFALATLIFWFFVLFDQKKIVRKISATTNLRRKIVHLFYGLGLVFLIENQLLDGFLFLVLALLGAITCLASAIWLPPALKKLIVYFERDPSSRFLGKGSFLFTISSFLAFLIFPRLIALAAIINLAVGDSVNALAGYYFKKKGKRVEASLAAFFTTALVSLQYIPPVPCLIGAAVTSLFEYSEPKIKGKKIDDNLLIPLASGGAIWLTFRLFY